MKIILVSLILLVIFFSGILISCNPSLSEEEYFQKLDDDVLALSEKYQEAYLSFNDAEKYEYTVDIYTELLTNYDEDLKLMPQDKQPSENDKWYKPKSKYSYVKAEGKEYVKIEYQEVRLNGSLEIMFEEDGETPVYESIVVEEYWFDKENLIVKLDSTLIYEGYISEFQKDSLFSSSIKDFDISREPNLAVVIMDDYLNSLELKNSIFAISNKQIFNKRIMLYKTINVLENDNSIIGFRQSDNTNGYEEDFIVTWENIKYVEINNLCVTLTNNEINQIEFNSEKIGSYIKETTQIWNNETVFQWLGDRIFAKKMIIDINYGTKKNPVVIP
jgi:hypothetical protein